MKFWSAIIWSAIKINKKDRNKESDFYSSLNSYL